MIKNMWANPKIRYTSIVLGVVIGVCLVGFIGYSLGLSRAKKIYVTAHDTSFEGLYTTQTATIVGKAVRVNGQLLFVQNERGERANVAVYKTVRIRDGEQPPYVLTKAAFLNTVRLQTNATFTLRRVGTSYQIITVYYPSAGTSSPMPTQAPTGVPTKSS